MARTEKSGRTKRSRLQNGFHPDDVFEDVMGRAADLRFAESEGRLAVTARHAFKRFHAGRNVLAQGSAGERVPRISKSGIRRVRDRARRDQSGMRHLVKLIGSAWKHKTRPYTGEMHEQFSLTSSAYGWGQVHFNTF